MRAVPGGVGAGGRSFRADPQMTRSDGLQYVEVLRLRRSRVEFDLPAEPRSKQRQRKVPEEAESLKALAGLRCQNLDRAEETRGPCLRRGLFGARFFTTPACAEPRREPHASASGRPSREPPSPIPHCLQGLALDEE